MRSPKTSLIIGILLLLVGAVFAFAGGDSSAGATQELACREQMSDRGPDASTLAEQCSDANFAAAVTATDAGEAAQSIGRVNQMDIYSEMLTKFLLGMGLAITVVSAVRLIARKG